MRKRPKRHMNFIWRILIASLLSVVLIYAFINYTPKTKKTVPETPAQNEAKEPDMAAKLDEYLTAHTKAGYFSGSVLIAKDGKTLLCKGYGMANYELDIPNTPTTKYRIGSLTKQFTAMAIMMLQEKGLLNVNDPISKFIKDYPNGSKITLHQLLTHTSGIPDYINDDNSFEDEGKKYMTKDKIMERFKNKPLQFKPGTKYKYSNTGYFILGCIIEKASGKSFDEYLNENIFKPLGMKNTGCDSTGKLLKERASGYGIYQNRLVNADYTEISNFFGDGNMYSTINDLYLWDRALYTEKLVSRKSLDNIFKDYISGSGYGWKVGENGYAYHVGRVNGFYSYIGRYQKSNGVIIVLSNNWMIPLGTIYKDLGSILFEQKYSLPSYQTPVNTTPVE